MLKAIGKLLYSLLTLALSACGLLLILFSLWSWHNGEMVNAQYALTLAVLCVVLAGKET